MRVFQLMQRTYEDNIAENTKKIGTFYWLGPDISVEMYYLHKKNSAAEQRQHEEEVLHAIATTKPDIFINLLSRHDLSAQAYQCIRSYRIPILIIFPDTLLVTPELEKHAVRHADYVMVYDSITNYLRYRLLYETMRSQYISGIIFAGGHQISQERFYHTGSSYRYDVAMIGSLEGQRRELRDLLGHESKKSHFSFYSQGGIIPIDEPAYASQFLEFQQYIDAISSTKIHVVSQTVPERSQLKGKVFENMMCQSFNLVEYNREYELFLPKGVVAYYTSPQDCINQIKYYLQHDDERKEIAQSGYEWYKKNFDYQKFWKACFTAIINHEAELPAPPGIEEIYQSIKKKINVTEITYADMRSTVDLACNALTTHNKTPAHITIHSPTEQANWFKNPLSNGFCHAQYSSEPPYLIFDYQVAQQFNVIEITHVLINDGIHLKDFAIHAGHDKENWVLLHSGIMENKKVFQSIDFKNKYAYRYYRIIGYSNYHNTTDMILANVVFKKCIFAEKSILKIQEKGKKLLKKLQAILMDFV